VQLVGFVHCSTSSLLIPPHRNTLHTTIHLDFLMADRYKQLLEERARAKSVLDGSAVWIAWRDADAALRPSSEADDLDRLSAPLPVLIPEDVVGLTDSFDPWDEQDPVLLEYRRVRGAEELKEKLVNSAEWHSFQEAQHHLLVFVKEELLRKRKALEIRRSSASRLSSHGDGTLLPPSLHSLSTPPLMLQSRLDTEITATTDSSSPPDASSSTLHTDGHGLTSPLSMTPHANQLCGTQLPSSSPPTSSKDMNSSPNLGPPSRSTSMAADSTAASRDSSASYSPRSQPPSITVAERSVSSASASGSQLSFAGPISTSSSSTAVTSEISASSTTANQSTSRKTRPRHSLQRPTSPPRSPPQSSLARLKRPLWCLEIVEDGDKVLGANQLGLVDQDLRDMCGSVRPQVQRIWSDRGPRCLLAALVTAQRFTPASWSHPTHHQMEELCQRVHDEVERWSDEQFATVITGYRRTEYVTKFLNPSSDGQLDMAFVRLLQAVDPAHPRVYVISVSSHAGARQASLDIIGNFNGASANTSCIVLYRHVSSDSHFEAVSWKPSRGGTPLTTSFLYSHEFIVALEKWKKGNNRHSPSPSATRKRRRPSLETGQMIDLVQDELTNGVPSSHEVTNQKPSS
jgi:hypothetical protein